MRLMYFVVLFLLIPFVSSLTTTMLPEYQPGETMIIEIQGNILEPIDHSDILFKRDHVAIAVNYDVKRLGDKYYIYAQMPLNQNNYTLFINDVSTTVNGQNQKINYNQSFSVTGNVSDYSIDPGFIIANGDFSLKINSNLDQPFTINTDFPQEGTINLVPGQNIIQIRTDSISPGIYQAVFGKYTLPIQITGQQTNTLSKSIEIFPPIIRETLLFGTSKSYNISIKNKGSDLSNIYFSFNQNLFDVNPSSINMLSANESINISISLKQLNSSIYDSVLLAEGSDNLGNVTFQISYTSNESQVTNSSQTQYYCSELNGKFCSADETCSGQVVISLDGSCCIGTCSLGEQSSNTWVYYVFVLVILIIAFFLYRSYKKTKIPKPKGLPIDSILKKKI